MKTHIISGRTVIFAPIYALSRINTHIWQSLQHHPALMAVKIYHTLAPPCLIGENRHNEPGSPMFQTMCSFMTSNEMWRNFNYLHSCCSRADRRRKILFQTRLVCASDLFGFNIIRYQGVLIEKKKVLSKPVGWESARCCPRMIMMTSTGETG